MPGVVAGYETGYLFSKLHGTLGASATAGTR